MHPTLAVRGTLMTAPSIVAAPPATEVFLAGLVHRESEFVVARDPVSGSTARRFGTCGPCALHTLAANARGSLVSTASVFTLMRSQHTPLCDVSGAATIGGLMQAASLLHLTLVETRLFAAPWPEWRIYFDRHAGVNPFLFETANGQALKDSVSGLGENATHLQYHYVAVVGRHPGGHSARAGKDLPPGYWCADGDNFAGNNVGPTFAAADVLQFYPDEVIAASRPAGALAVKGVHMPTVAENYVAAPEKGPGWMRDTRTNQALGAGLYRFVVENNISQRLVLGEEPFGAGPDSYCVFEGPDRIVNWSAAQHAATDGYGGHVLLDWRARALAAEQQVATLKAQGPQPDPAAVKWLALGQELKAALGEL
jgi:hypothetical protein